MTGGTTLPLHMYSILTQTEDRVKPWEMTRSIGLPNLSWRVWVWLGEAVLGAVRGERLKVSNGKEECKRDQAGNDSQ